MRYVYQAYNKVFCLFLSLLFSLSKCESISPLDDLAFDMYQDPEVAHIIRLLDQKKHDMVRQEKYEEAKNLKQAIADLQKVLWLPGSRKCILPYTTLWYLKSNVNGIWTVCLCCSAHVVCDEICRCTYGYANYPTLCKHLFPATGSTKQFQHLTWATVSTDF